MTAPTDAETQAKRRAALRARQKPATFGAPTIEEDDGSVTMTAEPGVVDRLVEALAPSSIEQAREHAKDWAQWRAVVDRLGESSEAAKWHKPKAAEREQLLAWVLDYVKATWARTMASTGSAGPPDVMLSAALAITFEQARALFDAAKESNPGWPS